MTIDMTISCIILLRFLKVAVGQTFYRLPQQPCVEMIMGMWYSEEIATLPVSTGSGVKAIAMVGFQCQVDTI